MKTRSTFERWDLWGMGGTGCRWRKVACAVPLVLAMLCGGPQRANAITIDFDSLADGDPVGTSYSGLTFENAIVLNAGVSGNEFEYPARSQPNVVYNSGGSITVTFDGLVTQVGGYFTYDNRFTLAAFDSGGIQSGSATSLFKSNLGLSGESGSSPNEQLEVSFSGGIQSVTMTADNGGTFTLDDFFYTPLAPVPENSATGLLLIVSLSSLVSLNWLLLRRKMVRQPAAR